MFEKLRIGNGYELDVGDTDYQTYPREYAHSEKSCHSNLGTLVEFDIPKDGNGKEGQNEVGYGVDDAVGDGHARDDVFVDAWQPLFVRLQEYMFCLIEFVTYQLPPDGSRT